MAKIGLAIQGGGSRGTYAGGPLSVLGEEGIWADEVVGTSCGGLMGCNYVAKDPARGQEMMMLLAQEKRWFNPFRFFSKGSMFDYDFLIHEFSTHILPFDFDSFAKNPCKFHVVASNCLTGKTDYLEKSDPEFFPFAIAASAALPLTTKEIFFHGVPYLDGGITCPIGFEKVITGGCDKVIVIATRARGYRKKKLNSQQLLLVKHLYKNYPVWLEAYERNIEVYNQQMDELASLEKEGKVFVIYPSKPPHVSHSERDQKKLKALMAMGKKDALEALPQLKAYLSK